MGFQLIHNCSRLLLVSNRYQLLRVIQFTSYDYVMKVKSILDVFSYFRRGEILQNVLDRIEY